MWLEGGLLVSASLLVSGRLWLSSTNISSHLADAIRVSCTNGVVIMSIAVIIGLIAALTCSRPLRRVKLFRPHGDPGVLLGVMMWPLVIASQIAFHPHTTHELHSVLFLSVICGVANVFNLIPWLLRGASLLVTTPITVGVSIIAAHYLAPDTGVLSIVLVLVSFVVISWFLLEWCRFSFTLGEATTVAVGLALLIANSVIAFAIKMHIMLISNDIPSWLYAFFSSRDPVFLMACPLVSFALLSGPLVKPYFTAVMLHQHRRLRHKSLEMDGCERCDVGSAYAVLFACTFLFVYPCVWLSLGEEPAWWLGAFFAEKTHILHLHSMTWLETMLPRTILLPVRLLLCMVWVAMLYFGIRYAPDAVMTDLSPSTPYPLANVPQAGAALDCPLCRACPECPSTPQPPSSIHQRKLKGGQSSTNGMDAPVPKRLTVSPLVAHNDNHRSMHKVNGNGTSTRIHDGTQHCEHCPTRSPSPDMSSGPTPSTESPLRPLSPASTAAVRRYCECSARDCGDIARRRVPRVVVRKYYHLMAILMFIPGVLIEAKFVCLAFGAALTLFVLGEFIRLARLPPYGQAMHLFMQKYLDSRDAGSVILTHTYLLLGCAMPLWLHAFFLAPSSLPSLSLSSASASTESYSAPSSGTSILSSSTTGDCTNVISASVSAHLSLSSPHTFLPALAGVLVLGIGDAVASLVGSYWGRHHWPSSPKTFEGTLGAIISIILSSFIVCQLAGVLSPLLTPVCAATASPALTFAPPFSWFGFALATILTCMLEATTTQIDNLFLPLIFYALIILLADGKFMWVPYNIMHRLYD